VDKFEKDVRLENSHNTNQALVINQ